MNTVTQNRLFSLALFSILISTPIIPNAFANHQIVATGGTITFAGGYQIHTFTSSGTFTITSGSGVVEYLVIAGGGGGGGPFSGGAAGGGGGGGYLTGTLTRGSGSYTVTVGGGGAGSGGGGNSGSTGSNSVFDTITATGGGSGGGEALAGGSGGSGGGGGGPAGSGGAASPVGQGNAGAAGTSSSAGGGGGGAGNAGSGKNGGNGLSSSITGSAVTRGGGGGGGESGSGGSGGGGTGGNQGGGTNGVANTGGGGGGGESDAATVTGGNGGSGIVIVRFAILPNAVTDLEITRVTGTQVDLDWSAPAAVPNAPIIGYQINYTTPHGNPMTIVSNNASASVTAGTVSGLTELTQNSFRVGARTGGSLNASGNIVNTTTLKDLSLGSLNLTQTNPDIIPIRFERDDINSTSLFLNITYSKTFTLSCNMHYKFAQINRTYTSIADVPVNANNDEASFRFNKVDNEIIDVFCWNQLAGARNSTNVNSTNSGRYIITQTDFLFLQQISDFRSGVFGTQGMFGVLDLVTLSVFIISMIGLNRVNEAVGGIFLVMVIGALAYFEIVEWPTFFLAAVALGVMLAVTTVRKE